MVIMGIDPGFAIVGYGIVNYEGNRFETLEYGCVRTDAGTPMDSRLLRIHDELGAILNRFRPAGVAVEQLYFNTNSKTAIAVAQARGVIVLAAAQKAVPVHEYTPLQVKMAVTGYGRADKAQIQQMVKSILCLPAVPKPDDVADALAISICHAHSARLAGYGVRR